MLQSKTVRKYDTYKDSGIEWIGEIPQEWSIVQVKNLFNIGRGRVISQLELDDNGEYPVYSSQTQNNGCLGYIKTYDFDTSQLTWTTDGANAGTVFLREGKHNCTNVCGTLQPKNNNINLKYMLYNLVHTAHYHKRQDTNGYKIMNNEMAAIKVCVPQIEEQQKIAYYLDNKCSKLDEVVETEKSVIEKLKEYKQSIITEAVTKGLDKSVPLKDSDIEWIGKIPQHWEVIKLKKTISLIADIDHYMPDTTDTGYSYLMTGDLKDVASKIDFENCKHISESDYKDLSKKIHPILDDVIFARYATIGTVCYVDIQRDFLVSYSCLTIRPDSEKLFGKFLYYYLMSDTFKIEVSQYINSNTQSNVGLDSLQKVYMVLPDKNEQQKIAEYLDNKCFEIDKAIADKEQVIEKFTEYKKSLIYECVTGKRKVVE